MREQGLEDSSVAEQPTDAGGTLTDSNEEAQEHGNPQTQQRASGEPQEYLTVAAQGKNVRKTTYLLVVLFGIGLLCLWFMIKKSTPPVASAAVVSTEETQIEIAITRLTGVRSEMFNRMDEIVKKFYQFSDVQQVKVDELVKNPFKYEPLLGNVVGKSDTGAGDSDDAEMMLRRQAENMQLLSIMATEAGSCCMIDDEILYEGDSIGGFRVQQIGDSFVKLEWAPILPSYREMEPQSESVEMDPKRDEERLGTQIVLKLSE